MKQSSIDFLLDKFGNIIGDMNTSNEQDLMLMEIIQQAREMHEEEVMQAHYAPKYGCFSKEYYNATFNSK